MPYITSVDKEKFSESEQLTVDYLSNLDLPNFAGHLNYLNYKIAKTYIAKNGKKYFTFCAIVGTLICCVLEIYRRLCSSYEDFKITQNGDVEV
jgi:hypothetical protein